MSRRLAALAWWVLLASVGALAVFLQLDRASFRTPALAYAVPPPLRHVSQYWHAAVATFGGKGKGSAETAVLLARQPIPGENLTLHGIALLREGDAAGAAEAFRLAGGRGWRGATAQRMTGLWAAANGEHQLAFFRLAALVKTGKASASDEGVLREVIATEAGRAGMVQLLRDDWHWRRLMTMDSTRLMSAPLAAGVLAEARAAGADISCPEVARPLRRALAEGRADVLPLWAPCAGPSAATPFDLSFAGADADDPATPVAWRLESRAGLIAGISGEGAGAGLDFSGGRARRTLLASRYTALTPGRYRVFGNPSAASASLSVTCLSPAAGERMRTEFELGRTATFAIPGERCEVQAVQLFSRQAEGRIPALRLERVGS